MMLLGSGFCAPVAADPNTPNTLNVSIEQRASNLFTQGNNLFSNRQFSQAITAWQQALALYQQVGDRRQLVYVLGNIGAAYEGLGQYEQAQQYFEESLNAAIAIGDRPGQSTALMNLGYIVEIYGEYERSLDYYEQALAIAVSPDDEAHILNQMGIVLKNQGYIDQAIARFEQSLAITADTGNQLIQAQVLGNLGNVHSEIGDYPEALDYFAQTLILMQAIGNQNGVSIVYQRMGNVYLDLGNPQQALDYYQQSSAIASTIGDQRTEAYNQGNIGLAYRHLGELDQAIAYLNQSILQLEQLNDQRHLTIGYNSLGNVYSQIGELDTAIEYYNRSLALAQRIGSRSSESIALGNLGQVYSRLGNLEQAIEYYEDSLAIAQAIGDQLRTGQALDYLGTAYFYQGNYDRAVEHLSHAVEIWESMRPGLSDEDQISLFDTQILTYQLLQRALIRLNFKEEALEYSERSRSRSFVELVASRFSPSVAEGLQTPPLSVDEMRAIADEQDATIVQYSILGESQVAVWVIRPDGEIFLNEILLDSEDLNISSLSEETRVAAAIGRGGHTDVVMDGLVEQTRTAIATDVDNSSSFRSAGAMRRRMSRSLQALYRILIDPIQAYLPDDPNDRVMIVPQGTLFLIPFAALQDEDGTYLIEQHTIFTAPSIQVLDLTERSRIVNNNILVVGNPLMPSVGTPSSRLSDLPHAEIEAIAIAEELGVSARIGAVATETQVVEDMTNARIIHLATHGLLNTSDESGIPGAIALTPSLTDDGLLTSNEILELSLSAEMVVLSACDTGRGRITGDGVVGLSRSFMAAGASSVVVSLWAVPDEPTAYLMTEFYRQLDETGDRAIALRQAMLSAIQMYPTTHEWAAFVVIGQPD